MNTDPAARPISDHQYQPLLARCLLAVKSSNAAQLLYRLSFWAPKAKIQRAGVYWIVNSADEWCHQTGLSYSQYNRAVALLKRQGWIRTEQHLFKGKNLTHVRLLASAEQVLGVAMPRSIASVKHGQSQFEQPELDGSAQLSEHEDTFNKERQGEKQLAFTDVHACSGGQSKTKAFPEEKELYLSIVSEASNLKESETSSEAAVANQVAQSPHETVTELSEIWVSALKAHFDGCFVPPLNGKQFGLLKQLLTSLPPGKAGAITKICVAKWNYFTLRAKTEAGAFPLPAMPQLAFLVKFVAVAANYGLQELMPAPSPEVSSVVLPKKAFATTYQSSTPPSIKEETMSLAEFLAIMAEDEAIAGEEGKSLPPP